MLSDKVRIRVLIRLKVGSVAQNYEKLKVT